MCSFLGTSWLTFIPDSTEYKTEYSTTTEVQYSSVYVTKAYTEVQTSTVEKPVTVYETKKEEKYVTVPVVSSQHLCPYL